MKWKPVCCVILLAGLILPAAPVVAATGTSGVSGTVPLVTYEVSAPDISYFRATISWKTNDNATSQVFYDTKLHEDIADYAYHTDEDTTLVSGRSMTLTRLRPATTYHVRVRSVIPDTEIIAVSDDYAFTTLSPPVVVIPPVPTAPPPLPPPSPPGFTPVSEIVTTDGIFTEEVIAESFNGLYHLTITEGTRLLTKDKQPLSAITMVEMEEPPPPPKDAYTAGPVHEFGPDGATFELPVTLTISYDPSLIPEGVNEEYLVIAYYHEDAGKWIELDSIVDTKANIISARVSHFTAFAVFGFPPVVPPVMPPMPPAAFTVSHLSVSPGEVYIGEMLNINVIVANIGGQTGNYEGTFKINGVVEATNEVKVNAILSKEITFTTTKDIAGTYLVDVAGLAGSFTVNEKPVIPEILSVVLRPINWPLIGGIIAAVIVVGLVVFFPLRRRAA